MTTETSSERMTLTVDEAAKALGIGRGLAYEAVRRGEIPTVRIGRRLLVPRVALERLLAGQETPPAAAQLRSSPGPVLPDSPRDLGQTSREQPWGFDSSGSSPPGRADCGRGGVGARGVGR